MYTEGFKLTVLQITYDEVSSKTIFPVLKLYPKFRFSIRNIKLAYYGVEYRKYAGIERAARSDHQTRAITCTKFWQRKNHLRIHSGRLFLITLYEHTPTHIDKVFYTHRTRSPKPIRNLLLAHMNYLNTIMFIFFSLIYVLTTDSWTKF